MGQLQGELQTQFDRKSRVVYLCIKKHHTRTLMYIAL